MNIDDLLKPISEEQPCGEDIGYDPRFLELESLTRGREETQFSPAEEPDWKALRQVCLDLFGRSKNLRVAVTLTLASLQLEGLQGFRDGMALIGGLVERYWDELYPRLDPEDSNDPTERVNIIASLANPLGTYGDPCRFLERLRRTPLTQSARLGRLSLAEITGVPPASVPAGETPPPLPGAREIEGAFSDTDPATLQTLGAALKECQELVSGIDRILVSRVGAGESADLDPLTGTLRELEKAVGPHLSGGAAMIQANDQSAGEMPENGGAQTSGDRPVTGINSRADVVRALDQICQFYRRSEPASPVPLILERARRLAEMDFMEIIADLAPDAMGQVNLITGRGATPIESAPPQDS